MRGYFQFCTAWLLLVVTTVRAEEARFLGALPDGTRVTGDKPPEWADEKSQPKLGNHAVFDAQQPFRWLMNVSLPLPSQPSAFVEFAGGDQLPGRIVGYIGSQQSPYDRWPEHLLIEPAVLVDDPRSEHPSVVRVSTALLQRVAWQRAGVPELRPGTVFLRDGREIGFRSLRWSEGAISLLRDSGLEQFPFTEVAEVHLPPRDPWAAYFDQLAVLTPQLDSRLTRLETSDGLRLTTSAARFLPLHHGNRGKSESWYQRVQPAWSLEPFWVRFDTIHSWLFFEPQHVPLSLIQPQNVRQQSTFGSGWRWQIDRNVHGQTLRSGNRESPHGFGVHAFHELTFPLPAAARSFRTQAGLDHSAGDGGCVRLQVWTARFASREPDSARGESSPRTSLFESDVLIGSDKFVDSGELKLPDAPADAAENALVLTVDPVLTGRPAGADPFDIRDSANWLEPTVTLDRELLQREVHSRADDLVPSLAGWTLDPQTAAGAVFVNDWDETFPEDPRYRTLVFAAGPFVTFSRTMSLRRDDRYLSLAVTRAGLDSKTPPSVVQVRIDGRTVAAFEPPYRNRGTEARPLVVPLAEFRGRDVLVELVQWRAGATNEQPEPKPEPLWSLDWRGVAVLPHPPGLLPIFDEDPQFAESLHVGEGTALLNTGAAFRGRLALKITPPGRGALHLTPTADIRKQPRLGEFRYLQFAWKKSGGKQIALEVAHDGEFGGDENALARMVHPPLGTFRLRGSRELDDIGRGLKAGYRYLSGAEGPPIEIGVALDRKLPEEWKHETCDLASHFGEFTFTGLNFLCPDGEAAWFDALYLAQSREALKYWEEEREREERTRSDDADVLARARYPQDYPAVVSQFAPLFSFDRSSDGVVLLKEYAGRQAVLRTAPASSKEPGTLRAAIVAPEGKKTQLRLTVSHAKKSDWQLVVLANGQSLYDAKIGPADEPAWKDIAVDLSRFAGQPVALEVQTKPTQGNNAAYWGEISVVSE